MSAIADIFRSTDPNNRFQQTVAPPTLPTQDYSGSIQGAQQGFGANQAQQGSFINMLQQQAAGQGPSVAQGLLQQGTEANQRAAASGIASQRGINPALAARMITDQQSQLSQQGAGQAGILRAQEMQQARGLLGSALGQQGQQQLGLLGTAGGLQGQQAGQQLQGYLGAQGINAGLASGAAAGSGIGTILGGAAQGAGAGIAKFALAAHGGELPMKQGGGVPGQASVPGDSLRNDTVPAKLSPGEIVLPRSVAQADDAPEKAAAFVRAIHRKHYAEGGDVPDYGKVIAKQRQLEQRLKALERGEKSEPWHKGAA